MFWRLLASGAALLLASAPGVDGQCFGGTQTFEKTVGKAFQPSGVESQELVRNTNAPILRDCVAFCRQSGSCDTFVLDYLAGSCVSLDVATEVQESALVDRQGSSVFEQICLRGVAEEFSDMCGEERLWAFERVIAGFLDGFDTKEMTSVASRVDCERACLMETEFACRSADYDATERLCYLSREDRRTQPQAFRQARGSTMEYLENQCSRPLPDCRYDAPQQDVMVVTADSLDFASSASTCEAACTNERRFECRAYTFDRAENRCYLSGDDVVSLSGGGGGRRGGGDVSLPPHRGAITSQRLCTLETCDNGLLTYEKVNGHILRGAKQEALSLPSSADDQSITAPCRTECDSSGTDCPAFVLDYFSQRCYRLDRGTQGRGQDLQAREGFNYFEKICLSGTASRRCRGRAWAFERVPGRRMRDADYRVLRQVPNRRDCQEACLADSCRSATYDAEILECRLSRTDRRRDPDSFVSATRNVEYLENQCLEPDSNCRFTETTDKYPRYIDLTVSRVDGERECERVCTNNRDFVCRSFSFYPTTGQCLISGDDVISAGEGAHLSRAGTNFYQRECSGRSEGTEFRPAGDDGGRFRPGGGGNSLVGDFGSAGRQPVDAGRRPAVAAREECDQFELITGVEMRQTRARQLLSDPRNPGILADCVEACAGSRVCAAFNLDHVRRRCVELELPGGVEVDPQDLVDTPGVSFMHKVCLRSRSCRKLYTFERLVNSELAVRADRLVRDVSKLVCQDACLEERSFNCRSATYDYRSRECSLSRENRQSMPRAFRRSTGKDYLDNQCAEEFGSCQYTNDATDTILLYTAKAVAEFSDARCRQACDAERSFTCASYTFLAETRDQDLTCLLSGVRATELSRGGTDFIPGSLYAERICIPEVSDGKEEASVFGDDDTGGRRPAFGSNNDGFGGRPDSSSGGSLRPNSPDIRLCRVTPTYEKVIDVEYRSAREFPIIIRDTDAGILVPCLLQCERNSRCLGLSIEHDGRRERCYGLENTAGQTGDSLARSEGMGYFEKVCLEERTCGKGWTYERVPNYMLQGHDDLVIPRVRNKEHCETLCLQNTRLPCRSAEYNYREMNCSLSSETRRSMPSSFVYSDDVDYLENQCAPDPPNCDYRDIDGRFLPYVDRVFTRVPDVSDCRRRCDAERDFRCRSYSFNGRRGECSLSGDDTGSLGEAALVSDVDSIFSERSVCRTVQVECTKTEMIVTFSFGRSFGGRVYATGNPQACFDMGNGRQSVVMPIPLGRRCGTVEEDRGRYVNHVVIQQHPTIMQQTDRTVRVECTFDADDQTITLAPTGNRFTEGGGVDVSSPFRPAVTSVVTNTAPTPSVSLRILGQEGRDVNQVGLGEELTFIIVADPGSAFGILGKSVEARTDNGELLPLIDDQGCPRDETIFPALQLDRDTKNLISNFRAFRFPSTARVNFFATVQFCQDECPPASCPGGNSYGRRRRSLNDTEMPSVTSFVEDSVNYVTTEISLVSSVVESTKPESLNSQDNIETASTEEENVTEANVTNGTSAFDFFSPSFSWTFTTSPPIALPVSNNSADIPRSELLLSDTVNSLAAASPDKFVALPLHQDDDDELLPQELPLSAYLVVVGEEVIAEKTSVLLDLEQEKEPNTKIVLDSRRNRRPDSNSDSDNTRASRREWDLITAARLRPQTRDVSPSRSHQICTPRSAVVAAVVSLLLLQIGLVAFGFCLYRLKRRGWMMMLQRPPLAASAMSAVAYPAAATVSSSSTDIIYANPLDMGYSRFDKERCGGPTPLPRNTPLP